MARTTWTAIVLGGLFVTACGGGGGGGGTPEPAPARANLSRVADCDELLETLRADARQKIAVQADTLRAQAWTYTGGAERTPGPVSTPLAAPTSSPGGAAPPRNATDTNVQVPGVDEADVIETDGNHIYVLRGSDFVILRSFPPEATAIEERIAIEGSPLAMFVDGGRALVLSQVYDSGDLGGDDRCDTIGPPLPIFVAVDPPIGGGTPPFAPTCWSPFVKLTLLDLTAEEPRTTRELYVEGSYVGARRHGDRVRTIVQRDWGAAPGIPEPWGFILSPLPPASEADMIARVDRWEEEAIAAIDASPLSDWLPSERERVDGALVDLPLPCENAHVTPVGLAQQGTTVIVGLDMGVDDASVENTLLTGRASTIYASGETLVLAHPEWSSFEVRTALHVFALPADSLDTVYRGSGFIPGSLLSQFAIDVRDDVLRVATIEDGNIPLSSFTRIVTARLEGDVLEVFGSTEAIAPGERLFAVRFLGNLAYLVTFLQIDPLFVVDLSDPAHPAVLGEVELPGFSEYLHPLGDHHLLTIGRDVQGPVTMGAALRIFDVTDPTAPRLTAEELLPNGGWTPAATNHLAFTFDTRLGLLALPFNGFFGSSIGAKLLLIAVDPAQGFETLGEITHGSSSGTPPFVPCPPPNSGFEDCPPVPTFVEMQRGLFIDDVVYSISTARVQAHALGQFDAPLADVLLP